MSCATPQVIITSPVRALWISSTETAARQTAAHIANTPDGFLIELQRCGQASASVPNPPWSQALTSNPYPTRLRPLSNTKRLRNKKKVRLIEASFKAIDVTISGGTGQDATTIATIAATVDASAGGFSVSDAYAQSRFRYSFVGGWQPNWFRPMMLINRQPVSLFADLGGTDLGVQAGDLSIGLDLPYCFSGDYPLPPIGPDGIEWYAMAAQYVAGMYQRYPILVECLFQIDDKE